MKIYFEKYGCSLNQAETVEILENYLDRGYTLTEYPEDADRILIGTCVVIQHTENHMVKRVEELSRYNKPVIVYGCLPTVREDRIKNIKNVYPLKIGEKNTIDFELNPNHNIYNIESTYTIPIAQGCNGYCTYCISRLSRGYIKSKEIDYILERVKIAISRGFKEIRISALDAAAYGIDINSNLAILLNKINEIDGDFMIRVGMMEPSNLLRIKDELLKSFLINKKTFKFFHIPIQSGSERVLKLMNRKYSIQDIKNLIDEIRSKFENYTFSTDIITGFPGEDDESFEETVRLVEYVKPDILNITRYSPRPNTPAYRLKMPRSIDSKNRSSYLTDLHRDISLKRNEILVGKEFQVLVTEKGKEGYLARTTFYRPVILNDAKIGAWYNVYIKDTTPYYLIGQIIK
ncbi:MAG: tRNA (N(6)-L-threonylcarbamoyladenosine(37)-C(2))-methylthiotransferase [Thermoplasmata archaeon]